MSKEHTVRSFEEALGTVTGDILKMGRLARDQLAAATAMLSGTNPGDVAAIQAAEDRIDDLDERIEQEVQRILALRQPMAMDMRTIISCDRIATDLERIADHANNIAQRAAVVSDQGASIDFARTQQLAELVLNQVDLMLTAIDHSDVEAAQRVWQQDDAVNRAFDDAFKDLMDAMSRQPETAVSYTQALFIAKALERIGDHVTNVAEDLVYWVSGERMSTIPSGDSAGG
jgi:phosphate transport system protein